MGALQLRRLFARPPATDLDRKTSFGCPMHFDGRSHRPGRCSICGMTLERAQARSEWAVAHAARADDPETRLARLALLVGVLGALALAGITLLLFPAYRGDVFAVLPWVPLAACPLFYLLGRGAGFRRGG